MALTRHPSQLRRLLQPCCLGVVCAFVQAGSVLAADGAPSAGLSAVEERLQRLEDELQATREELSASRSRADAQQDVLDRAGLTEDSDTSVLSSLSRFLEETQFEGWVTGSYYWNFNRPDNDSVGHGENSGNPLMGLRGDGLGYRFHPEHNSFQFDQAWFSMSREASEESRGGFALDVVFGQTADALRGEAVAVYQAYAEYLAPVGPGFLIRAGRFASPLRVEPVQAMHRFNITEGLVAGLLHPDTHTGATISTQIGPIRMMAGGANDTLLDPEGDLGDGKAVLFGAGFDVSETITVDASGIWGDSNSGPGINEPTDVKWKEMGIAGAVVRWFPSDLLTTYVNFTYVWADSPVGVVGPLDETIRRISGDPEAYAVVVGSHYMVSDQTSFSFRGEAVWGKNNILDPTLSRSESPCKDLPVPGPPAPTRCQRADQQIWSLTGTIDHSFTEHVGFRVEARLDAGTTRGSGADDNLYQERNGLRNHQWTTGVEAYYRF